MTTMKEDAPFGLEKLKRVFSGKNAPIILVIAGFIGIGLILLSDINVKPSKGSGTASVSGSLSTDAYASATEKKLTDIIGRIDGVGRVKVMVTVGSTEQNVYEQSQKNTDDTTVASQSDGSTQKQTNTGSEQTPVVMDNGSGGQSALVKTQLQPSILGVAVVCDGGGEASVQEQITNTIMSILSVSSEHISVCKMSSK
jgi:stage III sporulation protein AG